MGGLLEGNVCRGTRTYVSFGRFDLTLQGGGSWECSGSVRRDPEEPVVYGAQRPGYQSENVDVAHVRDWISFVRKSGVRRVCCLLPEKQLAYYRVDLLNTYREAFGQSNVCHAPIEDYHLCDHRTLEIRSCPFSQRPMPRESQPWCIAREDSAGLAISWPRGSCNGRALSVDDALEIVSRKRNPREAVGSGHATEKELRCLLAGKPSGATG